MPAKAKSKPSKVRVGFVGSGGIARHYMGLFTKNMANDVEIVAISDSSDAALALAGDQFSIAKRFKNYKDMLRIKELDAVCVCTPNYLHAQPTIDALGAGKHVIVEKPMAMNATEAAAMVKAGKDNKKILVIGFQYRYAPAAQVIKRAIDEGQFGKVLFARCQALRRRGIPNWGVFTRKDLQGGGPMIDIGVHIIEVAHYLMGSPKPVSAFGSTYTYIGDKEEKAKGVACGWPNWDYKNYTVEDLAVGLIRFDNGATLSVEASFAAHIEKDVFSFTLMGEKAGAQFEPLMLFKDEAGVMVNVTPTYVGGQDGFLTKLQDFIECVKTGKQPQAPGEHGLMVQQILDGVYRSAETGKVVTFK